MAEFSIEMIHEIEFKFEEFSVRPEIIHVLFEFSILNELSLPIRKLAIIYLEKILLSEKLAILQPFRFDFIFNHNPENYKIAFEFVHHHFLFFSFDEE